MMIDYLKIQNMRTFFRIVVLFAVMVGGISCSDDDKTEDLKPVLEVNYANVAGTWQLTEWNGEKMNDSRYYYIVLNRKEEDGKRGYTIYTNLNSATSQRITGAFLLEKDEDKGDLISGTYDYQLSTDDAWSHEYIISDLYNESMVWTAEDDPGEMRIYSRCEAVPADILAGTRAIR